MADQNDEYLNCQTSQNLNKLWKLGVLMNVKRMGKYNFSLIPYDMIMRTYYENKIPYDLMTWMFNYD